MSNTTIFIQQSPNFQFLFVCHYITTFGTFFYKKNLLSPDVRKHSVSVLNTLFDCLHNSKNESETKFQLLQKALKGSDLYGGGENETLDMKYVNETYQYIISNALFSHYGNINGYLAKIINQADNANYFALKETVFQHLSKNYTSVNFCSEDFNSGNKSIKLTPLAVQKVFHDHIWPIFPEPEQDMSIIDVNYIYAMVGLKIVRSIQNDLANLTFQNYTLISRQIDLLPFKNETYEMVLKLFSTPALLLYAFKEEETFREEYRTPINDGFSIKIYENLFSYINSTMQKIVHDGLVHSLHYKLQNQLEQLQSRTIMAMEILKVYCKYGDIAQVPPLHVFFYKTMFHWLTKLLLPDRCLLDQLPRLDVVFLDQFTDPQNTYNKIVQNSIRRILIDGELMQKMDTNVTVMLANVPNYPMHCMYCPPMARKVDDDIYLMFAIKAENKTDFYALRHEKNVLVLLSRKDDEEKFSEALGIETTLKMETATFSQELKRWNENSEAFIQRVAERKTNRFVSNLVNYYREPTIGEIVLDFVKSLVPFYSCVESVKSGDQTGAGFSCTLDVLSLIPMVGFGTKYTAKLGQSLTIEIGKRYFKANSLARALTTSRLPIKTVLYQLSKTIVRTVARHILKKSLLKEFAIVSLRSLDPGFELSYQISKFGFGIFRRLFRTLISNFRNAPKLANFVDVESLLRNLKRNSGRISDQTGLVPQILEEQRGFKIVRYFYPGESHFFGPKCVTSFGITAELRSIKGNRLPVPVVPVKSDAFAYRPYKPEIGKILDIEFEMKKNGFLRPNGYYLDLGEEGGGMKIVPPNQVYHHRVLWNRTPARINQNGNSNQFPGGNDQPDDNQSLANLRRATGPQDLERNSEDPNPGNSGISRTSGEAETFTGAEASGEDKSLIPLASKATDPESFTGAEVSEDKSSIPLESKKSDPKTFTEAEANGEDKSSIPSDSKETDPNLIQKNDLPGPSKTVNPDQRQDFGIREYDNNVQSLREFKDRGLPALREDREAARNLRITLNELALVQSDLELPSRKPLELWSTKIISRPKIVNFLKKLKHETFYFNDMTLLRDQPEIVARRQISLETEVRYRVSIDPEYNLVDLTYFNDEFENDYLVFSDSLFIVTDTIFSDRRNILTIEMRNQPMSRDEWINNRKKDLKSLLKRKKEQEVESPRMRSIAKASEFLVENLPLWNFEQSEMMLKNFILKTQPSTSPVPTYDKFAEELYKNMHVLTSYEDWIFKNSKYIDDVLFERKLDRIRRFSQAKEKIDRIYERFYYQPVDEVFNKYKTIPSIQNQIRFEDYYVLYSLWNQELVRSAEESRRLAAAIYRVALRQCGDDSITKPITLYRGRFVIGSVYDKFFQHNKKDMMLFDNFRKFSSKRDNEVAKFAREDNSAKKPVLYQIDLKNRAGVAEVSRVLNNDDAIHVVSPQLQLIFDEISHETIHGKDVLVVRMHDFGKPTEKRMVDMVRDLDRLLSTGSRFYLE